MNYIYPPLYKYAIFLLLVFLFLKNYKYITQDKYLVVAIVVTCFIILLDFMFINDHPSITVLKFDKKKKFVIPEDFEVDDLDL